MIKKKKLIWALTGTITIVFLSFLLYFVIEKVDLKFGRSTNFRDFPLQSFEEKLPADKIEILSKIRREIRRELKGKPNAEEFLEEREEFIKGLRQTKQTTGNYLDSLLQSSGIKVDRDNILWKQFRYYLNTSDWLGAVRVWKTKDKYLQGIREEIQTKEADVKDKRALGQAHLLFSELEELAACGPECTSPDAGEIFFDLKKGYTKFCTPYDGLDFLEFFLELSLWNSIFCPPAASFPDSRLWIGQGHHWAYFAWKEAQRLKLLPPSDRTSPDEKGQKTILFHYDAHRDLDSDNLGHPALLAKAKTPQDFGRLAQEYCLDGFIIPAVYEGLLDEIVWVVPEEARKTSYSGYVPPYGSYELWVGMESDEKHLTCFSPDSPLGDTQDRDGIKFERKIKIHLVDPADVKKLREISQGNVNIILDVDEDFLGSIDPQTSGQRMPHFPLADKGRVEELLGSLKFFYTDVKEKTKAISIARSPTFTYQREERQITTRLLEIFLDFSQSQPGWVREEFNMVKRDSKE